MPSDSARFSPCSLLRQFPSSDQELGCKMQPKYQFGRNQKASIMKHRLSATDREFRKEVETCKFPEYASIPVGSSTFESHLARHVDGGSWGFAYPSDATYGGMSKSELTRRGYANRNSVEDTQGSGSTLEWPAKRNQKMSRTRWSTEPCPPSRLTHDEALTFVAMCVRGELLKVRPG